ncbi:thiol reductant ABC exporter subunit CydD [Lichenihabitans sp. Uapishka_5]|uniref:thiol reductant ABC exporter subunit CydD n=1 Tax=Lichenihabitans sp. Uapishka_5 TaxID=3037302 RepID=UPI0029E7FD91|nr:thiol reductant ABC exporter subunit CydD [Lichenihabitans sp. Uapishka_5]MDX7952349.1 thiol reductant ABC exporter subunit CydD [Lichenihabitans sp. Uapishka_5]
MDLARQARGALAVAVAAPLLAGVLLLPQAWLFADLVERAFVGNASAGVLLAPLGLIAGLIVARAALVWCGEVFGSRAAQSIMRDLRGALFRGLLRRRPDWTAARPSGALSGAIVDQVGLLEGFFARYLPSMALATALPIVFALTALFIEPAVGLLFLVTAPLVPIFMALVGWGAEAAHKEHQQAFLRLSGFFADRLRGLVTLKLLGRAETETERLRAAGDDLRARTLGVLRIAFLSSAVLEFFAALGVAGVALYVGLTYLGFLHLHAAPLTLRAGLFCLLMAPEVYLPLRQFAAHYHDRAAAKTALEGLESLFDGLPSLNDAPTSAAAVTGKLPSGPLSVVVAALDLSTPNGGWPLLVKAEFAAAPGAHVALLGASGVGKSSFLEALAGLRSCEGVIELGGVPIADVPEHELRARVAVLSQRPHLLHGTIADNIRFARPDAAAAAVRAAAEQAGVMRFAATLPDGLDTAVGEGGLGLSGGEAHRVALARILLRDPDLILLDEPTAHLDPHTESAVLDAILRFANGRTLIVATHSAAVAARMERVLRIEGRMILATPHRRTRAVRNPQKGAA